MHIATIPESAPHEYKTDYPIIIPIHLQCKPVYTSELALFIQLQTYSKAALCIISTYRN